MNVSLTPDLERRIAEKVKGGAYGSPSDVVRQALLLLFEAEERRAHELERLDGDIQIGIEQADRGDVVDGEESYRRVLAGFATTRP